MTPSTHDDTDALAALLRGAIARRAPSQLEDRRALSSFLERADLELGRSRRWQRHVLWTLPVAVVVGVLVLLLSPRALEYQVEGAPGEGGYVRAASDRPATVRFSDQTTVVAARGSRLRIERAGQRSARVLLDRGRADVHVVHAAEREWTFAAGPFEALVTGTRFVIEWDPLAETFDLSVSEGSVEVRGPTGSGPVAVSAGEQFRGDAQKRSRLVAPVPAVSALGPAEPVVASPEPVVASPEPVVGSQPPPERTASDAAASAAPQEGRTRSNAPPNWSERMSRGQFAEIVAEAEARGIAECLAACKAQDLRALSDAARYAGKAKLAEQALLSLRERFGAGAGRDAAFSLGRLSEQRGELAAAERWYDVYARESPRGAFAAESLAGKMRIVRKVRGASAALPYAEEYLRRFPKGVHATTASAILRERE